MKSLTKTILIIVVPLLCAVLLVLGAESLGRGQEGESLKQLDNSVRKAVMTCYATEGVYPPSIQYLEDHYGIQIDHNRFGIDYQIFGDNFMPQIQIVDKDAMEADTSEGDVIDPDAPDDETPPEDVDADDPEVDEELEDE